MTTFKEKISKTPWLVWTAFCLAELILLSAAFGVGTRIGEHEARFNSLWGENYHRNFGGPRHGLSSGWEDGLMSAHGTAGTVIKIDGNTLVVQGDDKVEKIVAVTDQTTLRQGPNDLTLADIKTGDRLVVIGIPNDQGQIEAKFIRIFPNQ